MIKNNGLLAERLKGLKVGDKDLTVDSLRDLLTSNDEFELQGSKAHLLDDSQLEELKSNVKKEGRSEWEELGGKRTIQFLKAQAGLDYEGGDSKKFLEEITKKIEKEKGVEPNKKIQELSESLGNLQKSIQEKEQETGSWKNRYASLEKSMKEDEIISMKAPKLNNINTKQLSVLFKAEGYNIDFQDGSPIPTLHGKALKDAYEKPLSVDSVLMDFAKKNGWTSTEGRGAGDAQGATGKFKTKAEAFKYMHENKIDPTSSQADEVLKNVEAQ